MIVGQGAELLSSGLDQLLLAEAQTGAPQPRHALDVTLPLGVVDIDALAVADHQRTVRLQLVKGRVGMQHRIDIARLQIGQWRLVEHDKSPRAVSLMNTVLAPFTLKSNRHAL